MMSISDNYSFYHQTKIPIGFWSRQKLNHKSLIQLLETLLVELTRTHNFSLKRTK